MSSAFQQLPLEIRLPKNVIIIEVINEDFCVITQKVCITYSSILLFSKVQTSPKWALPSSLMALNPQTPLSDAVSSPT